MNKLVVMASGSGSNFEAIAKAIESGKINAKIELLIVNKQNAGAIDRADRLGIRYAYNDCKNYDEVIKIIKNIDPSFIILAGFMKILPVYFVDAFENKIINIHPSLLPKYKGLHAVEQAIEAGEKEIGATVHYVDAGMDTGEIIIQQRFSIENMKLDDIFDTLHRIEHLIYVDAIVKLLEEKNE